MDDFELDDDSAPILRPRDPRRRRLGALIAAGAVVLALAVILAASPTALPALAGINSVPTATAPGVILPGGNAVFLMDWVPWGTLSLDGRRVSNANALAGENSPLRLTVGAHVFRFAASGFPPLTCTLSVPLALGDTCPLNVHLPIDSYSAGAVGARGLDIGGLPSHLPSEQYQALLKATQTALDALTASATIQQHEAYLAGSSDAGDRFATAAQPLQVRLRPVLGTSLNAQEIAVCDPFCADAPALGPTATGWSLEAAVLPSWRVTAADGTVLVPDVSPDQAQYYASTVNVSVQWSNTSNTWQVATATVPGAFLFNQCQLATRVLQNLLTEQSLPPTRAGVTQCGETQRSIDGAVLTVTASSQGSPSAPTFLAQYGAVVALDPSAHTLLPNLPQASARQQTLARQILAQPAGP